MIDAGFSLGKIAWKVFTQLPSFKFRDRDHGVHYASASTNCTRQLTYKKLGYKESNTTDMLGHFRMRFGSWLERGLQYEIFGKAGPFGIVNLGGQNDTGEHGTFYGTSWHGYRDQDIAIETPEGKLKPVIVEIKAKVGYGASATIKETGWSKKFIVPKVPNDWGYANQIGLYLRDAYNKTKNNPAFSAPISDGILLMLLFDDGLACFLEFFCEYLPESDSVRFYRVHCEEYPQCSANINEVIPLTDVADHWKIVDSYVEKKELAPPQYQRKYDVSDPRVEEATKTDLTKATKGSLVIGDMFCKYCAYRDKCSEDLGINLNYTPEELRVLKKILASR